METSDYKVKLGIFEGPLDLLLYLIKKEEVAIHEVSINHITKQYLEYLDSFKQLNIEVAGEFVVMAANLMYLKSRELLPKQEQPPAEDAPEEDPRWDLIRQLLEYKKFKDAAEFLQQLEIKQELFFPVTPETPVLPSLPSKEDPLPSNIGVFDLVRAFQKVLKRFEEKNTMAEISDDKFTVADTMNLLLKRISPGGSMAFSMLFEGIPAKGQLITTFLAILELAKLNHITMIQDVMLDEIMVFRRSEEEKAEGEVTADFAG